MIINNNISSMNALRNLGINGFKMGKTMEKLSSGYRINRAADDAAGLAISEKMRAQISGLDVAQRNAQDGISMLQTAEGAMEEIHGMLRRMRDLALQANNGTNEATDLAKLHAEFGELIEEISGIAIRTSFNNKSLIDGTGGDIDFQIGANATETITIELGTINVGATSGLSINALDLTAAPEAAITALDTAINTVSEHRSTLGATQNRLEHTINNLAVSAENLQAAESRIRDADMAFEMSTLTKHQILQQAGTAMLAQANMRSQSVLSLLG
ncbi:MAG: flagellin [Halanaerobiales bacterium]|nr:flagellin [Halanaerobiales bacterium]